MLLLLVRTQPGVCGESPPSTPPANSSVRTFPTTTQTVPSVNASCAFGACALTFDNGTSLSSEEATMHVVMATTTNQVQRSKGDVSTVTSVVVSSIPPHNSDSPLGNSSLANDGDNRIRDRRYRGPGEGDDSATRRRRHEDWQTPRRKFRKGQRRNGGDRKNASVSSAWREETRFLWEPRDPVPVPGYAFGLAFGAVALAGLVGVGTACGGSAKPMLGTSWATAVTAIVVASAASRAAALLLLPEPFLRRLLQSASPAGLFLALALFWLALCRPALSRLVVAGACFVVLLVFPLVAESQAGTLLDARMLLVARLASLAAACLAILAALVAFPWVSMSLELTFAESHAFIPWTQDDAAEVPRRLPRPMARTTLRAALVATLLGLALALLLGHAALHAGQAAHPRWLWWTCRGLTLLAELCADACLAFAASRPAARCHAPVPTTATLLTPPGFASDSFGRPGGHRCGAIGSRGDPSEAAALCDSQSPAKTGLLGHATLQRTALLFHDQCVSSSVSTS
ncbi:hypothetical protein MTO96_043126, partial [Rhipicephalus appendiculatus]